MRVRIPETVESASSRHSAISTPVILRRRSAAIVSIRLSSVRLAIGEADLALLSVAGNPLRGGALAHSGGLGRLRERPVRCDHAAGHGRPSLGTEGSVSVQLHSVSSLVWVASTPPASKETRMNNVVRFYT